MTGLLVRQFRAGPWPTLLLAFTVAVMSLVSTLVPRMTIQLDDRQLAQSLGAVSASQGDVSALWTTWSVAPEGSPDPWAGPREAAEATRMAQPEPLRSLLRPAQFIGSQPVATAWQPPEGSQYFRVTTEMLIDPDLADRAELVDGAWPGLPAADEPFGLALVESFALQAGLKVGDRPGGGDLVVSAIFRPLDETDTRWEHSPYGVRYAEATNPDRGTELLGGVFLSPELAAGDPSGRLQSPFSYDVFYGLDSQAVGSRGIDAGQLGAQLTGMLAKRYPPVPADDAAPSEDNAPIEFHSDLSALLTTVQEARATTHTLIAVSAIGPLGVGLALVVLCAQLVLYRRRSATTLLAARGMSPVQLRTLLAVEGVAVGVPAALVGQVAAHAAVPGPVRWWALPITIIVALLPSAALALAAPGESQRDRRDAGSARGRWMVASEVLLALAGAGATWRLLTTRAAQASGLDVLGAASPVLLTLLACLLVLRIYPAPLRLLVTTFRRGRGFTGFMGSARALREPAGGIVPVVTIVLGTTISITSAALLGTISVGTERAVWASNGSTLHVSGPRMTDEVADDLRAIDGVDAVALVSQASDNSALRIGDREVRVRVWLSGAELSGAYAASRDGSPLPGDVFGSASPVPVVLGGVDTPSSGTGTIAGLGDVRVVGHLDVLPGVTDGSAWAFVARQNWPENQRGNATTALIAVDGGADVAQVSADVASVLPLAHITSTGAELDALRDSPTVAGLSSMFVVFTVVTGALMVLAIFTAQVMTADDRRSAAAVLRTLGLSGRQLRALTAWELGPVVVVALLLGVGVGVGIAALMLAGVDFRALTGGTLDPALHLDPLWVGGVTAGLLAASVVAVGVSSWLAGRTNIAEELRHGEER